MSRSLSFPRMLWFLAFISASSLLANAQFRASLRGTVTDPTGAAVPGTTVTLTNAATNQKMVTTTDANGIYQFSALQPAPYSLSVEHAGFKTRTLEHVQIIPEQLNALDLQLDLGDVQQTVTVSGTVQPLDAETATVSGTISSNQIQHMPSFNRDVFQLAQLAPGTFGDASQAAGGGAFNLPGNQGPGGTPGGSGGIFATENGPQVQNAGGQYETNSINIDGISTVSAVWGGTSVITPSEDSVETMKVVSNSYDAQNGRFTGAQIQVITKGGSNRFHGSAFFKASRPGLNAYQAWNGVGSNQPGTPAARGLNRDENRFNQYGGSLGGPIWKNKIFAFFNWETSPLASSTTAQGWYETSQFDSAAATAGSIAAKYLSFPGNAVSSNSIIQRTCSQIGLVEGVNCNTVSGGLDIGSPITTGLGMQDLTYGGNPSAPGVGGGLDGVPDIAFFNTVNPTNTSQMQYTGRVDANVTQKDRVTFTIYYVPASITNFNGPVRAANLWHHSQTNNAYTAIWNHTFSASLLNEARVNAAGWRWNEVASNPQEPFGLPATSTDTIGGTAANASAATVQYFGPPGPSILNQWTYSFSDVLTKIHGRHSIRGGGDFTRLFYLNEAIYAARPGFGFHNIWDFANDAPYGEGGNFGGQFDFQTGVPFSNRQDDRENLWGVFAQDDFKVMPTLTLNLGLRWSYFGALYAKQNNQDVMLFGPGPNPLDGLHIRIGGGLYTPQKTNFGPVVGFAWSPNRWQNKVVVRGGFGINYNQNEIAITANVFSNPPNASKPFFHCDFPFTTNPSCSGTGILYQTAGDLHSIFGYAPNPAAISTLTPENLPAAGNQVLTGFQGDPKTIANYHYSLDVQDQIAPNLILTLGYLGNQSRHLLAHSNWNAIATANGFALNPLVNTINFWGNIANGNYNAMVATVSHNFSHSFQATATYTWARAMDELSGPYYQDPYPFNPQNAYGRSNYDVRNAFKLYGLWQPVFFHGNHGWIEKVAGGWSVSGIWNWHTGFSWDPFYNASTNFYYQNSGYGQLRPSAVTSGFGTSTDKSRFEQATNPNFGGDGTTFFLPPTFVPGPSFPATSPAPTPGIHRNSLNGPGYNDIDLSLAKAFGLPKNKVLGEAARFEIRADIFNLFNTTNVNVATIDGALGAVDPTGAVTSVNSNFGVAGAALGSRTIQLQARFSF
ncbi:MAG TPA: carboxypeptidase-like regulatory domain-containing protein [Candidatus Sulfotelmatobacter sp.]|nr:carboxypeptidase-like regulatory domain-containing protein [Candidatus Sulfotelmatobacter sp.]